MRKFKMLIKATISLVICLGIVFSVVGCSNNSSTNEQPSEIETKENTIIHQTDSTKHSEPMVTKRLIEIHEVSKICQTIYVFSYDADGRIHKITHNRSGQLIEESPIEPAQIVYLYTYDALGRLLLKESDNSHTVSYYYNSNGLLEKSSYSYMSTGEHSYTYDQNNRLIREVHKSDMVGTEQYDFTYNEAGSLTKVEKSSSYWGAEVYAPGEGHSEDSSAASRYHEMTATINENYLPFKINMSTHIANIVDAAGNSIFDLIFHNPRYISDDGYLIQIIDENATYSFYYAETDE